jgi:hypothetical protein
MVWPRSRPKARYRRVRRNRRPGRPAPDTGEPGRVNELHRAAERRRGLESATAAGSSTPVADTRRIDGSQWTVDHTERAPERAVHTRRPGDPERRLGGDDILSAGGRGLRGRSREPNDALMFVKGQFAGCCGQGRDGPLR